MARLFAVAIVAIIFFVIPRIDQADVASLGGRVMDQRKVPIPAARISVRNVFSGETQRTKSDAQGDYKVIGLRQGRYSVWAEAESYGCAWIFNVHLYRGQHTRLNITLLDPRPGEPTFCVEKVEGAK